MLKDFFEEILGEIKIANDNYRKSNDEKYLTQIRNVTGNSLNETQLIKLASKEKAQFEEEMRELFQKKQMSRVNILGENQNKVLEKKIFLQIIDFSWRSHLQYLDQLRQVIGLRQYGQKDPLSEFKKEAFFLFEGLLIKIKNDVIKLLLNLNIVVSPQEENSEKQTNNRDADNFKKVGRNDRCPCGSGKKFKHCHGNI